MSTDEKAPETSATPPKPATGAEMQELEKAGVPEVLEFLRQNATAVLVGAGIAVAFYLGYSAYRNYRKTAEKTAASILFSATSADQLQQVVNRYKATPSASLAALALAGQQYDEGQYELARHSYSQFLLTYPEHPLKASAELGQALCLEATGPAEDALKAFDGFLATHTNHFLRPMAIFGKARTLEQAGRLQEAKALYEDFVAANPESRWLPRAESAMIFLDKEMRAKTMPAANAVPAPAEPQAPAAAPPAEQVTPATPTPSEAPAKG